MRYLAISILLSALVGLATRLEPPSEVSSPAPSQLKRQLLAAVDGTDRIRVEGRYASSNPQDVDRILAGLEVVQPPSGPWRSFVGCACRGGPSIEFFRGESLLAEVSIKHGRRLAWKGWEGDQPLTPESARFLREWLGELD